MIIEMPLPLAPQAGAGTRSEAATGAATGDAFLALIEGLLPGAALPEASLPKEGPGEEKPPSQLPDQLLGLIMPGMALNSLAQEVAPAEGGLPDQSALLQALAAGMPGGDLPAADGGMPMNPPAAGKVEIPAGLAGTLPVPGNTVPEGLSPDDLPLDGDMAELVEAARARLAGTGQETATDSPGGDDLAAPLKSSAGEPKAEGQTPARDAGTAPPPEPSDWSNGHTGDPRGDHRGENRDGRHPAGGEARAATAAPDLTAADPTAGGADQPKPPAAGSAPVMPPARPSSDPMPASFADAVAEVPSEGDGQATVGLSTANHGTSGSSHAGSGTAPSHVPTTGRPFLPHPASEMVSVHLSRMANSRTDQMTIQLRPAELGRVEVKLDISKDGHVAAMILVDRPEAFDLLQRDARGLEKALQDAGLQTNGNSLNFSLRDQNAQRQADAFAQAMAKTAGRHGNDATRDDGGRSMSFLIDANQAASQGRLDIRI